jgi:hypothetical protein
MNTCIRASFECLWEEIEASIRSDLNGEAADFIDEYSLVRESENSLVMLCDLKNFEALVSFVHKPAVQEAYNSMGVTLKIYSMRLMER